MTALKNEQFISKTGGKYIFIYLFIYLFIFKNYISKKEKKIF